MERWIVLCDVYVVAVGVKWVGPYGFRVGFAITFVKRWAYHRWGELILVNKVLNFDRFEYSQ